MSLTVDGPSFRAMVADPAAAESLSAAVGCPLTVVEVEDGAAGKALAGLDITTLASVVVLVTRDPGCLPPEAFDAADVILTEDVTAPAPFTAPAGGVQAGLDSIEATVADWPLAAATLALLLRSSARLPVPAALIAESAAYSTLQEGSEFHTWRASRPERPPEPDTTRVTVGRYGDELRIALSRPAKRNAVDWLMRDALAGALADAAREPALRVAIAGAGPDFCTGGDLDEFGSRPDPAIAHLVRLTRSPALLMHRLSARTTVHLHGACLGAGIELPAFAGRVVAASDVMLGLPELRLGLIPGAGGTASVTRRIGPHRTAFLALSRRLLNAADALGWGLVDAIGDPPPWRG